MLETTLTILEKVEIFLKAQELKDLLKKAGDFFKEGAGAIDTVIESTKTAACIVEVDPVEEISHSKIIDNIKDTYALTKGDSVAVLKIKKDNCIAAAVLLENKPVISAKFPVLLFSYKTIAKDLEDDFGDKEMFILK